MRKEWVHIQTEDPKLQRPKTGRMGWMAHRKRKETKPQPSMLPGPAVPGPCLVSFHILRAILSMSTALYIIDVAQN